MKKIHLKAGIAVAALLLAAAASATPTPFVASYAGVAQIVEVMNPAGPVVRFETTSAGSGPFDLSQYFSTDIVDLSTGVGSGSNRFVSEGGDELFGAFTVQIVPTATAGVLDLFGTVQFTGGTGLFHGASGSAGFTGSGVFTSDTTALSTLNFVGEVSLVPEPGTGALMLAGLASAAALSRRARRSRAA